MDFCSVGFQLGGLVFFPSFLSLFPRVSYFLLLSSVGSGSRWVLEYWLLPWNSRVTFFPSVPYLLQVRYPDAGRGEQRKRSMKSAPQARILLLEPRTKRMAQVPVGFVKIHTRYFQATQRVPSCTSWLADRDVISATVDVAKRTWGGDPGCFSALSSFL
jgi:hypothetical protein